MGSSSALGKPAFYAGVVVLSLMSAFFVFYAVRLLYVTRGLTAIRTGGQGAYVGALVFPMLAILSGWCAWRCYKAARRT